jgi:hypothetical protein
MSTPIRLSVRRPSERSEAGSKRAVSATPGNLAEIERPRRVIPASYHPIVRDEAMSNTADTPGRLDWCCIGAQKAGTSTLYRLLRDHPQIVIPSSKEDPLFDSDVAPEQVQVYLDERFGGVGDAQCGTVTPQYLSAPDTAARMHALVPAARIVVLLRDPVTRALSHYRMSVLRELETRTFEEAVAAQIGALRGGRELNLYSETDSYVVRGNYAWLLADWFELYGHDKILTVFSDDLDNATVATLERVQRFLGVDPKAPEEVDFRFNANPPRHRLSHWRKPVARVLRRAGLLDRIDPERKERITSRIERTLARTLPAPQREIAPDTVQAMREYYAPGFEPLANLIGTKPPWPAT